jgi:putative transcriptional regulator
MEIKCRLSTIMGSKRLKIVELHNLTGIARDTISSLYNEKAKGITFEVMAKLCAALDCQPGDLFEYIKEEVVIDATQVQSYPYLG